MSRIFISHSHADNAAAIAVRDWMRSRGWDDVFLDLDPERGLKAGERWQDALKRAAHRCELVVFLISPDWARSKWCLAEFLLAKSLNKRIFAAVVAPTPFADLAIEMTAEWQIVDLTAGNRDNRFTVTLPPGDRTAEVALAGDGLERLAIGLRLAGLDARYFAWPPAHEPGRPPYRGLKPLEADDAGIFFGREAPVIEAIDRLRGLAQAAPPRLLVILGASGSGKSSFLRAGLLPRLGRDPQTFLPLPVIRPERAAISGETGLVGALAGAFEAASLKVARGDIREAVAGGAATLRPLLAALVAAHSPSPRFSRGEGWGEGQPQANAQAAAPHPDPLPTEGVGRGKAPTIVIAIDQGEELFLAEAQGEAAPFLALLRDLVISDAPAVIAVFTIRSDNYERLQTAPELEGVRQETLSLPPMPKGSYAEVVKGPIRRLDGTARAIRIDDALVDALLADIEAGGAKDALPLLAFTLERLYEEFGATGHLTLDHFDRLGRVKGSIEAAVERAFAAADKDARIPRDRAAGLTLLRRGLIPWLAGIDPDTKAPRRRVARLSEIPAEARPLIDLLVEQRLLSTDVAKDTGETTIEPAHEALLRQWGLLQGWLDDDTDLLTVLDGIKRAARDWAANGKVVAWLAHGADRLRAAERLLARPDLAANLEPTDKAYVTACRKLERSARSRARWTQAAIYTLLLGIIGGMAARMNEDKLKSFYTWATVFRGHQLSAADLAAKKPGDAFFECVKTFSTDRTDGKQISIHCPEMVVVPAGSYRMGGKDSKRIVTIAQPIAVSRFTVTFDQWDACVAGGGCEHNEQPSDQTWGRGSRPAINVDWRDAQTYVAWLNRMTGTAVYRLLSEAEWEYAARGVRSADAEHPDYPWGNDIGKGNANCSGCGSQWDHKQTAPIGSFNANDFGLYDMHGNVWQWIEDCWADRLDGAPSDGTASKAACKDDMSTRVVRAGSWNMHQGYLRSSSRSGEAPVTRLSHVGFRVARDLSPARTK